MRNYLKEYQLYVQLSCTGSTVRQYSNIIAKYLLKVADPNNTTYAEVLNFVNSYNSNSAKKQAQGALMHFYKGVVYKPELIVRLPKIKSHHKLPEILSEKEAIALVNGINNLKHKAIIALLYYTALRISEVIHLRLNHIDGATNTIHIKFSKGAKSRILPVSEQLILLLRNYFKQYRPVAYLFKGQNRPTYSQESIRNILRQALLQQQITKNITPHCLRHSRATHLLNNGVDIKIIKEFLGHSKLETTENYLHLATNAMAFSIAQADELIKERIT